MCQSQKIQKRQTNKKITFRDDYNRKFAKFVYSKIKIDRENNQYYEIIKNNQTGEIIHECKEPLSEHCGHGSDKNTKKH